MSDPREWSSRQRDAVLASLLSDYLATVPTARTFWCSDPAELDRRADQARVLARQMDTLTEPDPDS